MTIASLDTLDTNLTLPMRFTESLDDTYRVTDGMGAYWKRIK